MSPSAENDAGLYAKLRCWLGRPRCHRHVRSGIDYACCNYCHRQVEVHERFDRNWLGPEWERV